MAALFTDFFRQQVLSGGITFPITVKVVLFRNAPSLEANLTQYASARNLAELTAFPGWMEVEGIDGYPLADTTGLSLRVEPNGTSYVIVSAIPLDELQEAIEIQAVGLVLTTTVAGVVNPLVMATNTPTGGFMVVDGKDSLTAVADVELLGGSGNRWLFGWEKIPSPKPAEYTMIRPTEGPVAIIKGAPDFETSNTQHVWLYPQRVNMVANPSFEKDTAFWASNGTLSQVAGGAPRGGTWAGRCAVPPAPSVYLNGTAGTWIQGPDIAALAGATEVTLEIDCSLVDWTPAANTTLVSQYSTAAAGAFHYVVGTSGIFNLLVSNGTTAVNYISAASGFVDGSRHVVGGVWRAATSSMQHKRDGADFGAAVTAATFPTGMRNSALGVRIGAVGDGSFLTKGNIYALRIYAGAALVASPDFTQMTPGQTSVTDAQGNVWTLAGAAIAILPSVIVESNIFPTQLGEGNDEHWTIQLMAKGDGVLKVGLVYWDPDYRMTYVDWGDAEGEEGEQWQLTVNGWIHVACHRTAYQGYMAMVRLEMQGTTLTIDKVLAERGYLKDWPYFDGDTTYGARDDFSWYGSSVEPGRRGASYSLWYNHRRAVVGRLFARTVDLTDPDDNITDAQIEEMGLAYRWVPAGTTVVPHLDVLYPHDAQDPVRPKAPTDILPYADPADPAPTGVLSPW